MPPLGSVIARDIVTPVTTVLFGFITVTGLMLMLHVAPGLVRQSHEWLGVAFAAVALWHLARNWRAFSMYLRRSLPVRAAGAGLAAALLLVGLTADGGHAAPGAVFGALARAPLAAAAPAFGLTIEQASTWLASQGIDTTPDKTLAAIGREAGRSAPEIATLLATAPHR